MPILKIVLFTVISLSVLTACAGNRIAHSADVPPAETAVIATVASSEPVQSTPTPAPTPTLPPPTPTPTPKPSLADVLLAEARHSQGAVDAPVTFIEFSDFK